MRQSKPRIFFRSFAIPALILGASTSAVAVLMALKPATTPATPQERAWSVRTQTVQLASLSPKLTPSGRVESPRASHLSSPVTAFVQATPAKEGAAVANDELLIRLDTRDAQLLLAQREADVIETQAKIAEQESRHQANLAVVATEEKLLALARKSQRREQKMQQSKLTSELRLNNAREALERQGLALVGRKRALTEHEHVVAQYDARLERARAVRDQARVDLERTRVTAPFDGRVSRVPMALGDRVTAGQQLAEMYDNRALEVPAQIPVRYFGQVRRALHAEHSLPTAVRIDGSAVALRLDRLASSARAAAAAARCSRSAPTGSRWRWAAQSNWC